MIKIIEKLPTRTVLSLLASVTVIVNLPLLKNAPALLDADNYVYPLATERLLRFHEWAFFPFSQTYGGMSYSWLRALWVKIITLMAGESVYVAAHMSFSIILSPILISLSSYFLLRTYCSKTSAFFVGLITAVGFQYWLNMSGMDVYLFLPILGAIFLILRHRYSNPFVEMPSKKLFIMGLFCGFSFYTFQPTLLFIASFFIPWEILEEDVKDLWKAKTPIERLLKTGILVFVALFVAVAIFGEQWGPVKLKAGPNLKLAVLLFGIFSASRHWKKLTTTHLRRALILASGALIGFTPEINFWIQSHGVPPVWHRDASFPPYSALIPRYQELILGRADSVPYQSILNLFPLVFFTLGLVALVRGLRDDKRLVAPVAVVVFNVAAFFSIAMTAVGATKYLMAVYPTLILGGGVLFDQWSQRKLQAMAIGLVLLTCADQVVQRRLWGLSTEAEYRLAVMKSIAKTASSMGVHYVWTDDYWQSLQYSFLTRQSPIFGSYKIPWDRPPRHWVDLREADRVGVLLTGMLAPDSQNEISFLDKKYKLKPVANIGNLRLYEGQRVK